MEDEGRARLARAVVPGVAHHAARATGDSGRSSRRSMGVGQPVAVWMMAFLEGLWLDEDALLEVMESVAEAINWL